MLLLTLVAVACGWIVDHQQLRKTVDDDARLIERLHYRVDLSENHARAAKARLEVFEQAHKDRMFRRSIHDEVTGRPFELSRAVSAP